MHAIRVVTEGDRGTSIPLFVDLRLEGKYVFIKKHLKLLIAVVDAELLEAVFVEYFESKNVRSPIKLSTRTPEPTSRGFTRRTSQSKILL